jgi:hypothetical protein
MIVHVRLIASTQAAESLGQAARQKSLWAISSAMWLSRLAASMLFRQAQWRTSRAWTAGMFRDTVRTLCELSVIFFLACLAGGEAFACRTPSSFYTIIFDEVPTSLDAPLVVEVTITGISEPPSLSRPGSAVMDARVDRVVKGPVADKTLRLAVVLSDCSTFGVGSHGIVLGTLRHDAKGRLELVPIQETAGEYRLRKEREHRK